MPILLNRGQSLIDAKCVYEEHRQTGETAMRSHRFRNLRMPPTVTVP
jgi:hypothetical protein